EVPLEGVFLITDDPCDILKLTSERKSNHPKSNHSTSENNQKSQMTRFIIFFCYFWKNMKAAGILLVSILISQFASAHNYYFGFAEMQYNATNQTLETTVVLS